MREIQAKAQIPEAFKPLTQPARYKAFFGGRGSAKSHSFARVLLLTAATQPLKILCCREIQQSIRESVKALLDEQIKSMGLADFFTSQQAEIKGRNGSAIVFAGLKSNPDAIKSMESLDRAWVEEANMVSGRSIELLRPTVRNPGSEIWFSWNPESEVDAVDAMFRGPTPPPDSVVKRVSWRDNPWFPKVLEAERAHDMATDPAKAEHVWEGGYRVAPEGAYYAKEIALAVAGGRVGRVPWDPAVPVHAAWDLGISSSDGNAMAIWLAQVVGGEIHVLEFLEGSGEALSHYTAQLERRQYTYAPMILPHDAAARELGTGKTREEVLRNLGYKTTVLPNLGVQEGIDLAKREFHRVWFDQTGCDTGLKALREYRDNWDEKARISRGPLKDWTNHAADAFRELLVGLDLRPVKAKAKVHVPREIQSGAGWMV